MKRRDFLFFFILGGLAGLLGKKAGMRPAPRRAMFWRKAS